jgi:hypothetical protein
MPAPIRGPPSSCAEGAAPADRMSTEITPLPPQTFILTANLLLDHANMAIK